MSNFTQPVQVDIRMLTITSAWAEAIAGWDEYLRAANRPATTRTLRTYHLRRLAHDHQVRCPWGLTFDDLIGWLADHQWQAETRRSYRSSLRGFYGWGHARGFCRVNPAYELPPIRVPRALPHPVPDDVIVRALAHAQLRERLMLLILSQTGIRRAELATLHTRALERDLAGWSLRIIGKGGRERVVPICDDLARILHLLPEGFLFPGKIDGHLSPRRVGEVVSDVLGPGWTAHSCRHRFASLAYAVERDLRAVQELLGHARPETTAVYTLVPDRARRRAALAAGHLAASA